MSRCLSWFILLLVAACSHTGAARDGRARADSAHAPEVRAPSHVGSLVISADTPVVPLPPGARPDTGLELSVQLATSALSKAFAPGELFLVRADGRAIGYVPGRGAFHDIPGARYDSTRMEADDTPGAPDLPIAFDSRWIERVPADTGNYLLTVTGIANGVYMLAATAENYRSHFSSEQRISDIPIALGAAHHYRVRITPAGVTIERIP